MTDNHSTDQNNNNNSNSNRKNLPDNSEVKIENYEGEEVEAKQHGKNARMNWM